MKYYKLTCIKDMPDCEKGFSYTVSEDYLNNHHSVLFSRDTNTQKKICALLTNHNNKDFVYTSIDLSKAITEIKCPHCNEESLFAYTGKEYIGHDDSDSTDWYVDSGLECGLCSFKKILFSTRVRTKVHW